MKLFAISMTGLSLALATGCHKVSDNHEHDHGEPRTAQITVWTDRYEVFAEHRVPVAGMVTTFITHVTDLHTSEPLRDGEVRFLMRQDETAGEHSQAAPSRPGIYLPGIVFPKPGAWRLSMLIPTDGSNALVELGAIMVYADEHAAEHSEIPDGPKGVSFLKEQQWKILSGTEPAMKRRLVERLCVAARVRAKPGFSTTVVAPVSGQLSAPGSQPLPQPGRRVEAGQLLALLKPSFSEAGAKVAEAQAEFVTARAALDQAEASYKRTTKLAAEQAKSQRELQEAELAYQSAKARYGAASGLLATFRQAGEDAVAEEPALMELRAPIAGLLNSIAAGPGEVVAANQELFHVLNPEMVWIEAAIPEIAASRLSLDKDAFIELPGQWGRFIPLTSGGRGRFVSQGLEVEDATRTVPLLYEASNADGWLRVGQSLNLYVETDIAGHTLAIPSEAIVEEGGRPIAFIQVAGETFEKRDLTLGIRDGDWVQVLSGLKEGERVVTKGAYAVKLASLSTAIPAHGHAH